MLAAEKAGANIPIMEGISRFYRAMGLYRQGKQDEARRLAANTAAQMRPLPKDDRNPLVDCAYYDTQIMWLEYKEAKAMIKFEAVPPTPATNHRK